MGDRQPAGAWRCQLVIGSPGTGRTLTQRRPAARTDFDTFTYKARRVRLFGAGDVTDQVAPVNDAPSFTSGPPGDGGRGQRRAQRPWATAVSPRPPGSEPGRRSISRRTRTSTGCRTCSLCRLRRRFRGDVHACARPVGLVHVTVRAKDDGGPEDWNAPSQLRPTRAATPHSISCHARCRRGRRRCCDAPEDPTRPWLIDVLGNDDFAAGATVTSVTQGTLGLATAPDGCLSTGPDPDER